MSVTLGPARQEELPAVAALCHAGLPAAPEAYFAARFASDPRLSPGRILVARDGEAVVATVSAYRFALRIGSAALPCGGLANVVTAPAFRRRGLARGLLGLAHDALAADGVPLSILGTALPGLYAPLGYARWDRAETDGLRPAPLGRAPEVPVRTLDPARDADRLAALHAGYDAGFAGPLVRSPEVWTAERAWTALYPREDPELAFVAGEPPRAYVRCGFPLDPARAVVTEFAAGPGADDATEALAEALARGLAARGVERIRFPGAGRALAAALAARCRATVPFVNPAMMARLADWPAIVAVLARAAVPPPSAAGPILLRCGARAVRLRADPAGFAAEPAVVPVTGEAVAELEPHQWVETLFGVRAFSAQPFARRSRLSEAQLNLVDALFSRRPALFWESDAF